MNARTERRSWRRTVFDAGSFAFLLLVLLSAIFQPTTEQLLDLRMITAVTVTAFSVGMASSWLLTRFGVRTAGAWIFYPRNPSSSETKISWWRKFAVWQLILLLVTSFAVGILKTRFSFYELLNEDGFAGAVRLFRGLLRPNFTVLPKAVLNIVETIFMAYLATVLAVPFAFVLSFFCARNLMSRPGAFGVYLALRTLLNLTRSVEALIWAIIFSVWVGIGPFAGMLALWIHSIASLGKQYSEVIENVGEGPIEAIQSTGANHLQTVWFAVVPQVILQDIAFTVYCWDVNVRMATVIGLVGGGGIGTMLIQYQGQAMWPEVGCIILVIAVVVWLMDQASAALRESLK